MLCYAHRMAKGKPSKKALVALGVLLAAAAMSVVVPATEGEAWLLYVVILVGLGLGVERAIHKLHGPPWGDDAG